MTEGREKKVGVQLSGVRVVGIFFCFDGQRQTGGWFGSIIVLLVHGVVAPCVRSMVKVPPFRAWLGEEHWRC